MYDLIVLGGGPGGYVAGIKASQLGMKVAIIEKNKYGGVCLNVGCIPTKTMLKSARLFSDMLEAEKFGIDIDGSFNINWENVINRKDGVVNKLVAGVEFLLKKNKIDMFNGLGNVIDKNTVEVNGEKIVCKNLLICTGSNARIPEIEGTKEALEKGYLMTSTEILKIKEIPKKLTIIGGGVIGVEFAILFATLGTKVSIIQRSGRILDALDKDVIKEITEVLDEKNVEIIYNANTKYIGNGYINYISNEKKVKLEGDKVLVCIGRVPNLKEIKNLNLEIERGAIKTNNRMETSVNGVYAAGDVNGIMQLAHVASHEGVIAVENMFGGDEKIDYNKAPYCIYTFPEVAGVGLTESKAKKQYPNEIKISKFPLSVNGKALAEGEEKGFVKIIATKKYNEVIGVHIVASHATDMISEMVTIMELEGTAREITRAIHPHPTMSEAVVESALGIVDRAIHI
ncbi:MULTISPECIES: dihydrolipoyl dehydrogenase [Psychrilyobacter]|uniref:Dihydrolipoyl dehydrogenase n=1 Tax=Psychrilyobacter piezotolerans TaxID=2293438 RepID=A0ABX9KHU6_9FUSO|nr:MULTISPECIES: dihydrolipoyl dehydrogenase [Psychrilyobacter]MCS5422871.1 dihydrolipoyl dehydrogenase [Psychrilyobacter sp. S5]NDI77560.1 dihydrolipoyl dehydrogenase [Psychrilyobacter piezotolerans]RDE62929.1 dihydrolipoyl dehydrogenase [Psychrilyobacter sp. S5]REI41687.1 dihydrolipoyl dehydrogenase [Psychrilyobacter piezotolerans]